MDRTRFRHRFALLAAGCVTIATSSGCLHQLLATGIYVWQGGNLIDAECNDLDGQRVVVLCRPPASNEYRHAGASRQLAERISALLEINGAGIDVVDRREVDNWTDENGADDFKQLGRAMKADRVVEVEIDHFDLFKGKTLYQGNADVTVTVYDMQSGGRRIWDRPMGEVLFPKNSGVPAQDKSIHQFQKEFVEVLADAIARNFYRHDPTADFANDALANR
ncbi:MAG: hypothetical protein AAGG46_09575 [Planctomycetota bacterium]